MKWAQVSETLASLSVNSQMKVAEMGSSYKCDLPRDILEVFNYFTQQ